MSEPVSNALERLMPVCPYCFRELEAPLTYIRGERRPISALLIQIHVTCECGEKVVAHFWKRQHMIQHPQ